MSTPQDMRDCESRNSDGYPCWSSPSTRPRIGLTMSPGSAIGGPATFNQPTDNSVGKRINDPLPWLTGIAIFSAALALGVAVSAIRDSAKSERESRMLEYYVLEMDAKLIAAGFKTDAESIAKRLKEQRGEKQ